MNFINTQAHTSIWSGFYWVNNMTQQETHTHAHTHTLASDRKGEKMCSVRCPHWSNSGLCELRHWPDWEGEFVCLYLCVRDLHVVITSLCVQILNINYTDFPTVFAFGLVSDVCVYLCICVCVGACSSTVLGVWLQRWVCVCVQHWLLFICSVGWHGA